MMDKAFELAMHGKKGVVHIDLPKDILTGFVEVDENLNSSTPKGTLDGNEMIRD